MRRMGETTIPVLAAPWTTEKAGELKFIFHDLKSTTFFINVHNLS